MLEKCFMRELQVQRRKNSLNRRNGKQTNKTIKISTDNSNILKPNKGRIENLLSVHEQSGRNC